MHQMMYTTSGPKISTAAVADGEAVRTSSRLSQIRCMGHAIANRMPMIELSVLSP